MAQRILRPLGYSDILDETFDLYKRNLLLFMGIAGVLFLPGYLLVYSIGGDVGQVLRAMGEFVMLPVKYIVVAASTWAVSQRYLGNSATIAGSYRAVARRAIPMLATMVLALGLTIFGFALLIVPGVFCVFWFAFKSQVVIMEDKSMFAALKRSRSLVAGHWVRIFVLAVLALLIATAVASILCMPVFALIALSTIDRSEPPDYVWPIMGFFQGLAGMLVAPVQVIPFVLLYYDIRVRKEGFDLELLAASMGEKPPEEAVPEEEVTTV